MLSKRVLFCFVILLVINSFTGLSVHTGIEDSVTHAETVNRNRERALERELASVTPDQLAELQLAAKVGANRGYRQAQEVQPEARGASWYKEMFYGKEAAVFPALEAAASNPYVKAKIGERIDEEALSRNIPLSPALRNHLIDRAVEEVQPSFIESTAAKFSGYSKASSQVLGVFASSVVGTTAAVTGTATAAVRSGLSNVVPRLLGSRPDKVVNYGIEISKVAGDSLNGDVVGAGSGVVVATAGLALPKGTEKLLKSNILKRVVSSASGWIKGAVSSSPSVRGQVAVKAAGQVVKVGSKPVAAATFAVAVSLVADIEGQQNLPDEMGLDIESKKYYQAPIDQWSEISFGEEGYVYRKVVDNGGVLLLYAKDKDGVIQRQDTSGQWRKVGHYDTSVAFGSEEDKYNQAPVGEWATIGAGSSGWKYRKMKVDESEKLVLYALDPNGALRKQNEDGTWVLPNKEEFAYASNVIQKEEKNRQMIAQRNKEEGLLSEDDLSILFSEGQCDPSNPTPECFEETSNNRIAQNDQSAPICGEG